MIRSLIHPKNPPKPQTTEEYFLTAIVNYFSFVVLPLAFSISLPVFLNQIVLEEETNVKKIMSMHGMKSWNYYSAFVLFSFLIYGINNGLLIYLAVSTYRIQLLCANSNFLVLKIFSAWGFSQISFALFLSNFVKTSKSAILLGYIISISLIFSSLYSNINLYQMPKQSPGWLAVIPQFGFVRIFYLVMVKVNSGEGFMSYHNLDPETKFWYNSLWVCGLFYLTLGLCWQTIVDRVSKVAKKAFGVAAETKVYAKQNLDHHNEEIESIRDDESHSKHSKDELLRVVDVSKKFRLENGSDFQALKRVNFTIEKD